MIDTWWRIAVVLPLAVVVGLAPAAAGDLVEQCRQDPTALRSDSLYRDLRLAETGERDTLMRRLAAEPEQPWDVRVLALLLTDAEADAELWAHFVEGFQPIAVAADGWGDEAFNALARWMPHRGPGRNQVEAMLLVEADRVLAVLAGRGVHDYLVLLLDLGVALGPEQVRALGDTDDEHTRRLLNWYVGQRRMSGMEDYLVDQVCSERISTYPSQARRLFELAFTAGISELFRAMAPEPPWLGVDTAPKGLALSSLGILTPEEVRIEHRRRVQRLLAAAGANAAGEDRGQWRLAVDILDFLHARGVRLGGRADGAVDALMRQTLRRRGPLEPFVAAERLHRDAGVPLPRLSAAERAQIWDVTLKTLDAGFLGAVTRALPDEEREAALRAHLRSQKDAAIRGSLRVVRCWGCDIEAPGEWARAVAALGMTDMLGAVEQVLDLGWGEDDTVLALVAFGEPAVPALVRFLGTRHVNRLDEGPMVEAIGLCARYLEGEERETFVAAMRAGPYTSGATEVALGSAGHAPEP